jgi:uncharacterized membrane protein YkvA (DUF1232 family)
MAASGKLIPHANRIRLGTRLLALWKLLRHPETPRVCKVIALVVLAYALSPIDLIPDFIPVLGQLDDLILVPLGIALVVRLAPAHQWQRAMSEAEANVEQLPRIWWGAFAVVAVWLLLVGLFVWWMAGVLSLGALK